MNALSVVLVYAGLLTALAASISVVKPLKLMRIRTRARSLLVLIAGLGVLSVGLLLPQGETRVTETRTRLDEFAPVYQFSEVHRVRVRASRGQVYAAIRAVTPGEIALFGALTWVRRLGRRGPQSILNAPEQVPLLDTATHTGFLVLAEDAGREIVIGTVMGPPGLEWYRARRSPEQFKALQRQHVAKIAMNFQVESAEAGECEVRTETRVYATDLFMRRAFAEYWRVIYPGSALIRRMWLRAIRRRAEAMTGQEARPT